MASANTGFFLTIEGCEGAGKTTAVNVIKQWLDSRSIEFTETREPGGTPMAENLRSLLLDHGDEKVADITELLLMFAARSQNLFHNIEPALKQGRVVLCDRFTDATFAYQGGGRQLGVQQIATLETLVQGERRPDMTILLDVEPEVGLARARSRAAEQGGQLDRIEQEAMDFFSRVRNAYLERARQYPEQFEIIDAGQPLEVVKTQLLEVLERRLGDR
ncbi:thymidylate kinase [Endozoicomonas montiporae]|uniref:Thymidylate kinase n=2 Tax=Endozoicomonas montiporae TaxID=1027273 RepID=A0A081NA36_9GAMM|nr:dTMP kinase [Endozoicomonas montiporae]AMO57010.1 thymidylate kinase [Endozoicomonas montiporae CL-33]KEQ15309.1 thymidylate kinase [Endozoicomonas montiporae]